MIADSIDILPQDPKDEERHEHLSFELARQLFACGERGLHWEHTNSYF